MKFKSFEIVKLCFMIKNKFLARHFLYKNFILQQLFQSTQHFYEKGKNPDPDPYLWLTDPDADTMDPDPEHCLIVSFLANISLLCIPIRSDPVTTF